MRRGGRLDRVTGRLLVGLGTTVCRRWREPDEGIWETRGGRRHQVALIAHLLYGVILGNHYRPVGA